MKPTVLVVEDNKRMAEDIKQWLVTLPGSAKRYYGVDDFVVKVVYNGQDALSHLEQARSSCSPYSVVLLDLELPGREGEASHKGTGFDLLKQIIEKRGALGVVVVSQFDDYKDAIDSFPFTSVEFISKKTVSAAVFQDKILNYFEREGLRILDERVKRLIPQVQRAVAYELGLCFSEFVQTAVDKTEAMESGFRNQWGRQVDDQTDEQVRHLIALKTAADTATVQWRRIQSALTADQTEPARSKFPVETCLTEIKSETIASLMLKNVELILPDTSLTSCQSFEDDVRLVLFELVLGALSDVPHHTKAGGEITAFVDARSPYVEVGFRDNFKTIPAADAEAINAGHVIESSQGFSRAWGLSLAQFVAKRGGGSLLIEPRPNYGNLVTYRIPMAEIS